MKSHIMIALGLLMAALFSYRMANALLAPGVGWLEFYLFGGIIIAAALIFGGIRERNGPRD
ncbi:MAG: hypothetical protein AAFQ15_11560 [Pseudomonadota bacterium]